MDRFSKFLVALLGLAIVATVATLFLAAGGSPPGASTENVLGNPPGMTDRLDFFDSSEAWERGRRERVALRPGMPAALVMEQSGESFPRTARWTSAETPTEFSFTELLPSWNVSAPQDTGLRLEVRARDARSGNWSPWLYLGSWGRTGGGKKTITCRQGVVHVDYLTLRRPSDAYQVRVEFQSFSLDKSVTPALRRVAVCYSGVTDRRETVGPVDNWARDLKVPFHTQRDAPKPLAGEVCSPTSVTMVLGHWGVERPVVDNALAIYDDENEMFGNWGRAVARAGELGMEGWLTRFRNWEQVKAQITSGQPVIASIRFKDGSVPSAVMKQTAGHLIVIRGFTPGGDVIVNDPASRDRGNGAVYKADELARAWFDHGGVADVIRRPGGTPVAMGHSNKE